MSETLRSTDDKYTKDQELLLTNIRLKNQYESKQQELYDVRRQLEAQEVVQKELQEANELLERSFVQQIAIMEQKLRYEQDRYRDMQEENKNCLLSLDVELAENVKVIKELQDKLSEHKRVQMQTPLIQLNSTNDMTMLDEEVQQLKSLIQSVTKKVEEHEGTISVLKDQNCELQDMLHITKGELAEKNKALEQAREKLIMCRLEMESKENVPSNNDRKGNSLFAEVEDRRQADVAKLGALHNKYTAVKRAVAAKDAIIRALKAEIAAFMKWKNDTGDISGKNSELTKMYKNRIVELEEKLKSLDKNKEVEVQSTDVSFTYLESLLAGKKKEIRELEAKIESNSVHALIQEETKHDLTKQLRYWRYKAMSFEAELSIIKSNVESNQLDTTLPG